MQSLASLCSLVVCTLLCVVVLADETDPVADRLEAAKATFEEDLDTLQREFLKGMEKSEDAARKKGDKKQVDEIKAERSAFESKGVLPQNVPAKSCVRGLTSARSRMRKAFTDAIAAYVKLTQDDNATRVENELKDFERDITLGNKQLGIKDGAEEPVVVATWAHEVRKDGKIVKRQILKIYSNGRINDPVKGGTWEVSGRLVTLSFPAREAPGGVWKDVLTL